MTNNPVLPQKRHIGTIARQLTQPYTGAKVAAIDEFGLSVFLCQGMIAYHRHMDEDELFLIYSGAITIDSEMGPVFLRAGEMTVVPKGIRHRNASPLRSEVIIFQQRMLANQRNGDRRLYAVDEVGALSKINLYATALKMRQPFVPQPLVQVDDFDVSLIVCEGTSEERYNPRWTALLLVQQGDIDIHTDAGDVQLHVGDTLALPRGVRYAVSAESRALLLDFSRKAE